MLIAVFILGIGTLHSQTPTYISDTVAFHTYSYKIGDTLVKLAYFKNSNSELVYQFYPGGNAKLEYATINGRITGMLRSWYQNGKIKEIAYYLNGCLYGPYCSWTENGILKEQGQYWINFSDSTAFLYSSSVDTVKSINKITNEIYIVVSSVCALKHGAWKYYLESGKMIREEIYSKGLLVFKREFK